MNIINRQIYDMRKFSLLILKELQNSDEMLQTQIHSRGGNWTLFFLSRNWKIFMYFFILESNQRRRYIFHIWIKRRKNMFKRTFCRKNLFFRKRVFFLHLTLIQMIQTSRIFFYWKIICSIPTSDSLKPKQSIVIDFIYLSNNWFIQKCSGQNHFWMVPLCVSSKCWKSKYFSRVYMFCFPQKIVCVLFPSYNYLNKIRFFFSRSIWDHPKHIQQVKLLTPFEIAHSSNFQTKQWI